MLRQANMYFAAEVYACWNNAPGSRERMMLPAVWRGSLKFIFLVRI